MYAPAAYAFLIAVALLNLHNNSMPPIQYLALDKFSQFLHIVPTLLAQGSFKSIFIRIGNFKSGLTIGLVSFAVFAALAILMGIQASEFYSSLWKALLWLLLFIFANAIMEELWFRGIFLRPYENIIGQNPAIMVTALIFGISHMTATYEFPGGGLILGLVVFSLGLVGAYAMYKSYSLIGPILFHAGYDLLVIVPVHNSL